MTSLRGRAVVVTLGAAAVATSMATVAEAGTLSARTGTPITRDDNGSDDGGIGCGAIDDLSDRVAAAPAVVHARSVLAAARRGAVRAGRTEATALRALRQAQASGSAASQARTGAAYRQAHATAITARRRVVRAKRALATATRRVEAALLAASCTAPPPVTPTPTPTPVPPTPGTATPSGLVADSASSLANGAFRLRWTAVVGATGYRVSRGGTLIATTARTSFTPPTTTRGVRTSYTVAAVVGGAVVTPAATVSAGPFTGKPVADASGSTVYGDVTVTIVATGRKVTGCWATFPTSGTSAVINTRSVPVLCREAVAAQSSAIAGVSGASALTTAFVGSLQDALSRAGI